MSKVWDQALEEEAGTLLLFGPPEGIKLDPRFPMPVSVRRGGETVHYVSRQEAEFGKDWLIRELEKPNGVIHLARALVSNSQHDSTRVPELFIEKIRAALEDSYKAGAKWKKHDVTK